MVKLRSLLLPLLILSGCESSEKVEDLEMRYFQIALSSSAANIHFEKPGILNQLWDGHVFIEYNLPPKDLTLLTGSTLPGYSEWKKLGEIYSSGHFFSNAQIPDGLSASKIDSRQASIIIVNPSKSQVSLIHYLQ